MFIFVGCVWKFFFVVIFISILMYLVVNVLIGCLKVLRRMKILKMMMMIGGMCKVNNNLENIVINNVINIELI